MRPTARSGWRWRIVAKSLLLLLIGLGLAGCTSDLPDSYRAEFYALGTQVDVQIRIDSVDNPEHQHVERAFSALNTELQRIHREWHPWEAGAMANLNAGLATDQWVETTPDLIELIIAGQRLEASSLGLFNPAIGHLINLWGFHTSTYPITEPPPEQAEIQRLLDLRPSSLAIEVDGSKVRSLNSGIRLDFSGLAKGLTVRRCCELLAAHGFNDALVNAGGDVMVCGPSRQAWRVAIRNPSGGVLKTIAVDRRTAVFTSGNYHRYGQWDGERYAHILDPHTGRPVDAVIQATVMNADPLLADAAATTLVVAGSDRWRTTARRIGVDRIMLVHSDGTVIRTLE